MKIAVIFPSRGMAFSQTCEELLENLQGYDWDIFFSHGVSIPECFNKPLERALEGQYTHFWFVEDDMILPKNTLKRLLTENVPAVMCDYPMDENDTPAIFRDPGDNVIYGGTGCMLVTREFLETYALPVFHSDTAWDIKIGEIVEVKPRKVLGNVYGLHDVNFSLEAYKRGAPIKVSKVICGHRKLISLGTPSSNDGQHNIQAWTKLVPNKLKVKRSKTKVLVMADGTEVTVRADSPYAGKQSYVKFL